MKVLFAYCHELDRIVSIDEARIEYFAVDEIKRKRFVFSCSDRQCSVTVTGVNYHIKAEDGEKFKTAHYASRSPHSAECEWRKFEEEREEGKRSGESAEDYKERQIKRLLNDYIDSFEPFVSDSEEDDKRQDGSGDEKGKAPSSSECKERRGNPTIRNIHAPTDCNALLMYGRRRKTHCRTVISEC